YPVLRHHKCSTAIVREMHGARAKADSHAYGTVTILDVDVVVIFSALSEQDNAQILEASGRTGASEIDIEIDDGIAAVRGHCDGVGAADDVDGARARDAVSRSYDGGIVRIH